jgi:hypothetical protein
VNQVTTKQSRMNFIHLKFHEVNFPIGSVIARFAHNYKGNLWLPGISHVALRAPCNDIFPFQLSSSGTILIKAKNG